MKNTSCKILLAAALMLLGGGAARAAIDEIVIPNPLGIPRVFRPNETIPVPQGGPMSMTIHGFGTDLASAVDVSGAGVKGRIGDRKHGNGSHVEIGFDIDDNAAAGVRTVTVRYPLGQDTFRIKIVRRGTISKIEYELPLQTANLNVGAIGRAERPGSNLGSRTTVGTTRLVPAVDLPQDEKIILVLTGTKLDGISIVPDLSGDYEARMLPGATETRCKIEIEFKRGGRHKIFAYDDFSTTGKRMGAFSFAYRGASGNSLEVIARSNGESSNTGRGNVIGIGSSTGNQPATFIDVAPRANMSNVFRRLSNFAPFELNGLTFLRVEDRWCTGMNGNDSKIITIPDLIWGVSNTGTRNATQSFSAVLKTGGTTLDTKNIFTLNQGATQDFTFRRQQSNVRVRTRFDRQGCFISPDDEGNYFEDPPFTVEVDAANALGEDPNNRGNNARNF